MADFSGSDLCVFLCSSEIGTGVLLEIYAYHSISIFKLLYHYGIKMREWWCSSSNAYPLVVAAHPSDPNQFAVGLTDGAVHVLEPLESEPKWGVPPPAENSSTVASSDQQR